MNQLTQKLKDGKLQVLEVPMPVLQAAGPDPESLLPDQCRDRREHRADGSQGSDRQGQRAGPAGQAGSWKS